MAALVERNVKSVSNELFSFVFKWPAGSGPCVCLGVIQYDDQLVSCRRCIIRTCAPNATEHFQSTAGRLQVPHPWPDLNKVYPQKADNTVHSNTRISRRGGEKNTSLIQGTWWGWCPSLGLFFLSFCYVLILLVLLPLWHLRRCELFPTLDCKT